MKNLCDDFMMVCFNQFCNQQVNIDAHFGGHAVWKVALVIHVAAWILQFIGHGVFEGRAPALLDSLDQVRI
jgi:uncharacterized membrane protein YGL010W